MGLLKPRTVSVTIYQGDDLERLAELHRAVVRAEARAVEAARGPRRAGDEIPNADAEKAAYNTFVDEAAERAVEVRLRAIGSTRFADLMLAHPPRMVDGEDGKKPHEDDEQFGVNTLTFPKALLSYREDGVATVLEPEVSAEDLREFLDEECTEGDVEKLWTAAYFLNRTPGADPKDTRFSTGSLS